MGWRRGESLAEGDREIELCVHGHFLIDEDSLNGIFGAWWASVHYLIEKAGVDAVERVYTEFVDDLHDDLFDVFAASREAPEPDVPDVLPDVPDS